MAVHRGWRRREIEGGNREVGTGQVRQGLTVAGGQQGEERGREEGNKGGEREERKEAGMEGRK